MRSNSDSLNPHLAPGTVRWGNKFLVPPNANRARPRRWRVLALVMLLPGAVVTTIAPGARPVGAASASGLHDVGKWTPVEPRDNRSPQAEFVRGLAILPEAVHRRLWTIDQSFRSQVDLYDLDSMQMRATGPKADLLPTGAYADPVSGNLFMAVPASGAPGVAPTSVIDEYGVRGATITKLSSVDLGSALLPGSAVVGMYRVPASTFLYAISAVPNPLGQPGAYVVGTTAITLIDVAKAAQGAAAVRWSFRATGCPIPMGQPIGVSVPTAGAAIGYASTSNSVYFVCNAPGDRGTASHMPLAPGAARLTLTGTNTDPQPGHLELYPLGADYTEGDALFDPGTSRLAIAAVGATGGESSIYVFDTASGHYVGGISVGKNSPDGYGLDATKSRLYVLSTNPNTGMVAADIEPTPVLQGRNYGNLSRGPGDTIPASGPLSVDPQTRRVFTRYESVGYVAILRDDDAPYEQPKAANPDANTSDMAEVAGKTAANYSASSQGFGAIIRLVGGVQAVVNNVTPQGGFGAAVPLNNGSRELRAGWLGKLTLDNAEASAAAIQADRDLSTTQDASQVTWPFSAAQCADFGSQGKTVTQSGATVTCSAAKHTASAVVDALTQSLGVVEVGAAGVASSSALDARGVVATVTATAKRVSLLGGALRIGLVSAVTEAHAHGRSHTAASSFTRTISDVVLNGTQLCGAQCNVQAIADQINSTLSGRLRIDFPTPDASMTASPGGYQALVRNRIEEHIEDVSFNGQPADRVEVPAAVVTVFADVNTPSRLVVSLAGTEAEAHYGIYSLASGGPAPVEVSLGGLPPLVLERVAGLGIAPSFNEFPAPAPPAPAPTSGGSVVPRVIHRTAHIAWNGARGSARLLVMWALLFTPAYLAARRGRLLGRSAS